MSPLSSQPPNPTSTLSKGDKLTATDRQALLTNSPMPHAAIAQRRKVFRDAQRFVGLDIHRDYLVATAVDHDLRVIYGPRRVEWGQFDVWMQKTLDKGDAVVIEMTTNTWAVHDALVEHVHSVTVVHPPHVKLITKAPVMNDKKAAEALAVLHAAGLLQSVWVPDPTVRDWRGLVAQRHDRVVAASQAKNRLQSLLFRHQFKKPESSLPFSAKRHEFWLTLPVSAVEKLSIELDLQMIEQMETQRERIEKMMAEAAASDERLPFLVQLPGISALGAFAILAALGPIERFPTPKDLVGYAGLGARSHDSGNTHTTGRITKTGRRDLRHVMVQAAQAAGRSDDFWKAELARLEPRLGHNKTMVAIARKLLVVVWHVLTKREADKRADAAKVARNILNTVYTHIGARNLPDGQTAPEFVRRSLDRLGLGKDLQRVRRASHSYLLPPSSLPGAPPAAEPIGRGRQQNTKAAQEKRLSDAAAKREALAQKRAEAEARSGKPRKTRADKGTQRGPQAHPERSRKATA